MNELGAETIIHLLEAPAEDRRLVFEEIAAHAEGSELVRALEESESPLVRTLLCDILGNRHETLAVPELLRSLQDAESGVRASSADALAKIGDRRAGPRLLERFSVEPNTGVRQMIAAALGAVGCQEAIPMLIFSLGDPDPVVRGCAAWSLGSLKAVEAEYQLQVALANEQDSYAATRMRVALSQIQGD